MRPRGFTFIELLVTLALLALLASMSVPLAQLAAQRSKEAELKANLWQIRKAIDDYKQATDDGRIAKAIDASGYPKTLDELAEGVKNSKSAKGELLYFLRRIPRDPLCDCASKSAADSWGLRSYASPPDAPETGDDVYDVYSMQPGKGLNGVPYREW